MRTSIVASLALAAIAPAAAWAQDLVPPQARQGYFIGGGFRSGAFDIHADGTGNLGFMQGGGLTLRVGQMASPLFGFGLALSTGGGANDAWTGGYGALSIEMQLVAMETLAFRAGIGLGGLGVTRANEADKREDDPEGTFGPLYVLGMSYDYFPFFDTKEGDRTGGFAITPFFETKLLPGDGVIMFAAVIGLELTWWTGLEDHKLDLAPSEAYRPR